MVEKCKSRALQELEESKRSFAEANVRLSESLVIENRELDKYESEKFRVDELEQYITEVAQKRDRALYSKLEFMQRQHALDVVALKSEIKSFNGSRKTSPFRWSLRTP